MRQCPTRCAAIVVLAKLPLMRHVWSNGMSVFRRDKAKFALQEMGLFPAARVAYHLLNGDILRRLLNVDIRRQRALVRKLEIAYSSGTVPAIVEHASPYQWANACQDLWNAGRIDIVEYVARYLHAIYPELTYLSTLVGLFDAVPRHLPAPLAFCDDPAAEIQIVRRPDCEAVLLCFCAQHGNLGLPVNFVHQWLGRLPVSIVYIKDLRDLGGACGYATLGPDRKSALTALRRIASEVGGKRIYTLGFSLGGYPAMYYGLGLGAVAVLNLAGATDLTASFVDSFGLVGPGRLSIREAAPDYATNLRESYVSAAHKPRVLIAYGAGNPEDRGQAERMVGLPNVELMALDYGGHNVIDRLIRRGKFMPLLHRLLSTERMVVLCYPSGANFTDQALVK
jgi:hypothetical protein